LVHVKKIRVHWDDTDKAGIVHHANFFCWFEEGEVELIRESGKARKTITQETGTANPRVSVRCDYFSPAYEDDTIEIRTSVLRITKKTYHLRQEVHRPADGKHLATGEVVACCVKAREDGTYRSFPLPEEMVAALKRYLVPAEAGGAS
jgi:acyl-CoA thioester hydrolase